MFILSVLAFSTMQLLIYIFFLINFPCFFSLIFFLQDFTFEFYSDQHLYSVRAENKSSVRGSHLISSWWNHSVLVIVFIFNTFLRNSQFPFIFSYLFGFFFPMLLNSILIFSSMGKSASLNTLSSIYNCHQPSFSCSENNQFRTTLP